MQKHLTATRARIEQIYALRQEARDQALLAPEYLALTTREDTLMLAIRGIGAQLRDLDDRAVAEDC